MKATLLGVIFSVFFYFSGFSQNIDLPSNSFSDHYRETNPTLVYSYDESRQIHDYSGNWDFDQDGIKDELYFVGTGGAHLYFFLKVILSSDRKVHEFSFLESDAPWFSETSISELTKQPYGFTVTKLHPQASESIVIRLDENSYRIHKSQLKKNNIQTKTIAVSFEKGKPEYRSF